MYRSKILGVFALTAMMMVILTGCPSIIASIVGASESVQEAIDQASAGDTIKILGSHTEDVTIHGDNITISGQYAAAIDGDVTVTGNNVTLINLIITGRLDTVPGSFENLTLDNVTFEGWNNATVNGTYTCSRIVQPGGVIQDAIDAASPGESVCVAPGTYAEDVDLTKGLTLSGLNEPDSSDPAMLAGQMEITASNATLTKMNVSPGTVSGYTAAIFIFAGDTTIADNVIENMTGDGSGSIKGIHVYSSSGLSGVEIINNIIQTISVASDVKYIGAYGIMVQEASDSVTVSGNTIRQVTSTGTKTWAVGIEVTPDAGTYVPTNVVVKKNTLQNIAGGDIGDVAFQVSESSVPADASEVTLEKNNFLTDLGVLSRDLAHTLIATNNYWGDSSGPGLDGPGSGAGVRDGSLHLGTPTGDVDYDPWATSAF